MTKREKPKRRRRVIILGAAASVVILTCLCVLIVGLLPENDDAGGSTTVVEQRPTSTAASATIADRAQTIELGANTPLPTYTPTTPPTATSGPTSTRIPTRTPSPTSTPRPKGAAVTGVNLRQGPGTNYAKMGGLAVGDSFTLLHRTSNSEWCCIELPSGAVAWVAAAYISAEIDLAAIPTVAPDSIPPTPTLPPPTNTPQVTNTPVPTPTPQTVVKASAWVSNEHPGQNSNVTVYGKLVISGLPIQGAAMNTTWNYKTTVSSCSGSTGGDGVAACTRKISRATKGYTVRIGITFSHEGQTYSASTSFTPQ